MWFAQVFFHQVYLLIVIPPYTQYHPYGNHYTKHYCDGKPINSEKFILCDPGHGTKVIAGGGRIQIFRV